MAEIKFRAWDDLNKRIIYDFFFVDSDGDIWYDQDPNGIDMSGRKKIAATDRLRLMQYTGLKDKNVKEIYDGDIYLATRSYMPSRGYKKKGYPNKITVICVVEWSVYDAGWRCKEISPIIEHIEFDKNAPYHYYQTSLGGNSKGNADWIEVIGNIYENPELISQT